jgi:hypothetical protein
VTATVRSAPRRRATPSASAVAAGSDTTGTSGTPRTSCFAEAEYATTEPAYQSLASESSDSRAESLPPVNDSATATDRPANFAAAANRSPASSWCGMAVQLPAARRAETITAP